MHTEHLLYIFDAIIIDDDEHGVQRSLSQIVRSLQQRIDDPANPEHLNTLSAAIKSFRETAQASATNNFPISIQKVIQEMEWSLVIADHLAEIVDNVFRSGDLEPELFTRIKETESKRQKIIESMRTVSNQLYEIGVYSEELDPGEVIFTFSIPNDDNSASLSTLNKEIKDLSTDLKWLSSIAKDKTSDFSIRRLSSSDPTIVLNVNVDIAEILLYILGFIQLILLTIRKKEKALTELEDAPEKAKKPLRDWIKNILDTQINEQIEKMKDDLPGSIEVDELIRNKDRVRETIHKLAVKVQNGFTMDIDAGEYESENADSEGEAPEIPPEKLKSMQRVNDLITKSTDLKLLLSSQSEILKLPEPIEEPEDEASSES